MNTTPISDALYDEYATTLSMIEQLEVRKEQLKASILDEMGGQGLQQMKTEKATFTITATAKYKYSDEIETLENGIKESKKMERENGTATKEETPTLRVQLI